MAQSLASFVPLKRRREKSLSRTVGDARIDRQRKVPKRFPSILLSLVDELNDIFLYVLERIVNEKARV